MPQKIEIDEDLLQRAFDQLSLLKRKNKQYKASIASMKHLLEECNISTSRILSSISENYKIEEVDNENSSSSPIIGLKCLTVKEKEHDNPLIEQSENERDLQSINREALSELSLNAQTFETFKRKEERLDISFLQTKIRKKLEDKDSRILELQHNLEILVEQNSTLNQEINRLKGVIEDHDILMSQEGDKYLRLNNLKTHLVEVSQEIKKWKGIINIKKAEMREFEAQALKNIESYGKAMIKSTHPIKEMRSKSISCEIANEEIEILRTMLLEEKNNHRNIVYDTGNLSINSFQLDYESKSELEHSIKELTLKRDKLQHLCSELEFDAAELEKVRDKVEEEIKVLHEEEQQKEFTGKSQANLRCQFCQAR